MSAASDALLTKTDEELRFFVDNPQYYQLELVEAARRELRRRGSNAPAPAAVASNPATPGPVDDPAPNYTEYDTEEFERPGRRRALVPALVVLAVLVLGLGIYWWQAASRASQQAAVALDTKLSPDSLKLETAVATPLPTFDVEQDVARQLALVPAAEQRQATGQALRQYREVSRRFWLAQRPTEFLIQQASSGQVPSYAILGQQVSFLEGQWHQAGNALVYTYKFPPTMADQLARMRAVAGDERKILEDLKGAVAANSPHLLSEANTAKHAAAEALLEGLRRPAKPIEIHL